VNGAVIPDIPCTYGVNGVGELDYDLNLKFANAGVSTPFSYHFNDAATVYVQGNPLPSLSIVRQLEKTTASFNTVNPQIGLTDGLLGTGLGVSLQSAIVDKVGQKVEDLAGNACLAFSMIGDFENAACIYGDRGYRCVHFEEGLSVNECILLPRRLACAQQAKERF
jgi:hypothetical protein